MLGGSLQAFRGRVHVIGGLRNFLAEFVGGAVHRAAEPTKPLAPVSSTSPSIAIGFPPLAGVNSVAKHGARMCRIL